MDDLISRQEAIASRDETNGTVKVFTGRQVNEILASLPSRITEYKTFCGVPIEKAVRIVQEHNANKPTGDLISRQAAIDALNEYFARIEKLKRRGLTKGEKAISLDTVGVIKTLQSQWIPCGERLPEEHEWIGTKKFGTTISDKIHITFDVNGERFVKTLSLQNGELSNQEKLFMDTFYKGWKMLAWMPLPEPYREDGEV